MRELIKEAVMEAELEDYIAIFVALPFIILSTTFLVVVLQVVTNG
jgi:hypothetical protein